MGGRCPGYPNAGGPPVAQSPKATQAKTDHNTKHQGHTQKPHRLVPSTQDLNTRPLRPYRPQRAPFKAQWGRGVVKAISDGMDFFGEGERTKETREEEGEKVRDSKRTSQQIRVRATKKGLHKSGRVLGG
ncbi:hypothetical protein Salat_1166700 [Sesamum alatum]|uniref:Uncharacterized protein n=1 Tax=Sesamum alatum TaxID=300844 RepID=A0AAE1YEJ7_9LAMI|nr:hypothetical protein Salat_1166700 [Sesamum alatum]